MQGGAGGNDRADRMMGRERTVDSRLKMSGMTGVAVGNDRDGMIGIEAGGTGQGAGGS